MNVAPFVDKVDFKIITLHFKPFDRNENRNYQIDNYRKIYTTYFSICYENPVLKLRLPRAHL